METLITGKANVPTHVVVYEPRQTPEQTEVVIDEFDLERGENRTIELRSATAGFRLEDRPGYEGHASGRPSAPEGFFDNPPDQEPGPNGLHPDTDAEMAAGRERLADLPETEAAQTVERAGRADQRRAATASGVPATASGTERRRGSPSASKKEVAERAQEKTQGQRPEDADNPSTPAGSTGQAEDAPAPAQPKDAQAPVPSEQNKQS